ncbi:MAG: STAS domain-containing protein, partial [Clostridia bacterium]|nr:STAS domain-containing protein [Clostridia bacterium]
MKIQVKKEGTTLNLKPEERIDTLTAPDLDRCIQAELKGTQLIILDLQMVDYISSAGLRVLLATEQEMEDCGGSLTLIHCSDAIL